MEYQRTTQYHIRLFCNIWRMLHKMYCTEMRSLKHSEIYIKIYFFIFT